MSQEVEQVQEVQKQKKKKEKKQRVKKTPKQKFKIFLKVLLIIVIVIAIIAGATAITNTVVVKSEEEYVAQVDAVEYDSESDPQLVPTIADDGYYTFVTDEDFKILDLTDIHIGGGYLSKSKDFMSLNAVEAMIREETPDLVVITGDIVYPVPFSAGTFNNMNSSTIFADFMERLGVYWCPVFGNHDTESYSYYTREDLAELYSNEKYEYCLFQSGPEDVDGYGNYIVNVKNTVGEITQSLILLDSHSYTDGDVLGVRWAYDCLHDNQITWYEEQLKALQDENAGIMPKSLAFFHIPIIEFRDAWNEYADNNYTDTDDVTYYYGDMNEGGVGVYSSEYNSGFFDKVLELGSTQGIFAGHDHLNNFSLEYKGVRFTYGFSIDYLAYPNIKSYGIQRGCTVIDVASDGSFDCHQENYYQDKYVTRLQKEDVTMANYNDYE